MTKIRRLLIAATAVLIIVFSFSPVFAADKFQLHVLNVGQADCLLLHFPGGANMLIDAGDGKYGHTDHIVQYLKAQGIGKINVFVATHPHADHIGGAVQILDTFPVGAVWDSGYVQGSKLQQRFLQTIKTNRIPYHKAKAGEKTSVGGVDISILAPSREGEGPNNNSVVLYVKYGKTSFFLPGDMEEEERSTIRAIPKADVYKAAHHGSRNGTDAAMLDSMRPRYIVYSYKPGNSYGHPHPETVSIADARRITRFDTPNGDILFESDGRNITAKQ